jgi:hypothetical protein
MKENNRNTSPQPQTRASAKPAGKQNVSDWAISARYVATIVITATTIQRATKAISHTTGMVFDVFMMTRISIFDPTCHHRPTASKYISRLFENFEKIQA